MFRNLKILMMSFVVVGLMAGMAFAGTVTVNNGALNTPATVALEAMGAARNVTLIGGGNSPVLYLTTQNITSANFVAVNFTGGAFAGDQVRVCAKDSAAAGNQRAVGTPSQGSTSFNFQLAAATNDIPSGNYIFLTTEAACNATGVGSNFIVQIPATGTASSPSISVSIVSAGNIPVDPATSATVATIASEYAVADTSAANSHIVDYLGTPGTGVNFTIAPAAGATNTTAAASNVVAFNRTTKNFGAYNGSGASNGAGLTVSGFVNLSDSLAWAGVSKVFVSTGAAGNCADTAGNNAVGQAAPSGTVTLTVPAASYNGIGSYGVAASNAVAVNLCVVGSGAASLSPRTIQVGGAVNVTGVTGATAALGNADIWTLNAYQTWVSWMVNASTAATFCLVNNADATRTANILMDVVSSEGATNSLLNKSLGTVAAGTSKMITFTANSATLAGGVAVDITALGTNARYAPKITVTANPSSVNVMCNQLDPITGAKRNVNTLQNGGTWVF